MAPTNHALNSGQTYIALPSHGPMDDRLREHCLHDTATVSHAPHRISPLLTPFSNHGLMDSYRVEVLLVSFGVIQDPYQAQYSGRAKIKFTMQLEIPCHFAHTALRACVQPVPTNLAALKINGWEKVVMTLVFSLKKGLQELDCPSCRYASVTILQTKPTEIIDGKALTFSEASFAFVQRERVSTKFVCSAINFTIKTPSGHK